MASIAALGNASERDGSTKASARPSSDGTSSTWPRKSTRPATPSVTASARSWAARGPSPAIRNRSSGRAGAENRRGAEEYFVCLLASEVGHGQDRPHRAHARHARETLDGDPVGDDPVGDDLDALAWHPFVLEHRAPRRRIRHDGVSAAVGVALQRDLPGALVGIQLAPAADAHGNAGQRGRRQGEDVRVEIARLHDLDAMPSAPARENRRLAHRRRPRKAADRKRAHLRRPPTARRSHAPSRWKQPTFTANRRRSRRRMSSIICRSGPPG